MPLKLLAQMGKEPLPTLVRKDDSKNKVLALKAAGLVYALESEDEDEMLVCLTDKGRRALEPTPGSPSH
ncbi:hypothetical protein WKW77_25810 [Variovorax ureilyticus]|uniref:Uncharacterized protein n=1 Tax=Variovorax ureilyticus TaxID=1836198 RepID=A0ABU8VNE3_9BURK